MRATSSPSLGATLRYKRPRSIFKALCPFHDDSPAVSERRSALAENFRCWACGKSGDVFTFVQGVEKVDFSEAREILARRANISLDGEPGPNLARLKMFDAMHWAGESYRECLFDSALAEQARPYLNERRLEGTTVRAFGLGFAPLVGQLAYRSGAERRAGLGNFAGSRPFIGKERNRRVLRPIPGSRNVPDTRRARSNRWIRWTHFTRFTLRNPQSQVL